MRKIILAVTVLAITLVSFNNFTTETYNADINESIVEWAASRTGKTHNGSVNIKDGMLTFENGQLIGGDFTLNMTSIKVLDIPASSKMNTKLVDHLNSSDFFSIENHPTGKFMITGSESQNGKTLVKGNLTIKDISHDVSFLATIKNAGDAVEMTSDEFSIDRTKWDVKFRSGKFFDNLKDKLIYDDITISVKVKATK
jgi:polyisoprenoid-binding protein YceI